MLSLILTGCSLFLCPMLHLISLQHLPTISTELLSILPCLVLVSTPFDVVKQSTFLIHPFVCDLLHIVASPSRTFDALVLSALGLHLRCHCCLQAGERLQTLELGLAGDHSSPLFLPGVFFSSAAGHSLMDGGNLFSSPVFPFGFLLGLLLELGLCGKVVPASFPGGLDLLLYSPSVGFKNLGPFNIIRDQAR